MKLTFTNRIYLLGVLPQEGDILTLRILTDLKKQLAATEQEIKDHHIRNEDGQLKWEEEFTTDVVIGEKAQDIIKQSLIKLNEDKKLQEGHLALYEMFVEGKELTDVRTSK